MKEHQNDVYVQEKQNYLKQKKNKVSSFLKKKKKKKRCIHNKKFFKLKKKVHKHGHYPNSHRVCLDTVYC